MDDFESWTRSEISVAQAKIVEMERALALFLRWQGRAPNIAPASNAAPTKRAAIGTHARQRASKNDAIFAAFESAGSAGLSQEDVQRIAHEAGLNTNPNALRALCWSAKKDGRLISLAPGRYAIAPKNEAAPRLSDTGDGGAASTRSEHNQHRQGDVGGGI